MSEIEFSPHSEETPATEAEIELPAEDIPATEAKFRLVSDDAPVAETPVAEHPPVAETLGQQGPAGLGPEKRTCSSCGQENEVGREFCWACQTKLGDSEAGNDAWSQSDHGISQAQSVPPTSVRPEETRPGEDVLVNYGPSVKLAYNSSGQKGKTFTLFVHADRLEPCDAEDRFTESSKTRARGLHTGDGC